MNAARIEQLLKFLEETPDDPFLTYALALEYRESNPEQSAQLFTQVLQHNPEYLPAYYQAALAKEQAGQKEEALELYRQGIELARRQLEYDTLKELQSAFHALSEELEG